MDIVKTLCTSSQSSISWVIFCTFVRVASLKISPSLAFTAITTPEPPLPKIFEKVA
jgi:hypothetical protein